MYGGGGGGQTISGNNNSVAEDSEMNLNKDREIGRSISLYKHDIIELLTSDDLFKLTELVEKVTSPPPPAAVLFDYTFSSLGADRRHVLAGGAD